MAVWIPKASVSPTTAFGFTSPTSTARTSMNSTASSAFACAPSSLPDHLFVDILRPIGNDEISGNTSGRTANKGMEGLAITPDGKTLVGIMQAALIQDAAQGGKAKKLLRLVTIDIASGQTTHEYAYLLTTGSGVSEITALNQHEFLVDERDGAGRGDGSVAVVKHIFKIDLNGAVDVTAMDGPTAATHAVTKSAATLPGYRRTS